MKDSFKIVYIITNAFVVLALTISFQLASFNRLVKTVTTIEANEEVSKSIPVTAPILIPTATSTPTLTPSPTTIPGPRFPGNNLACVTAHLDDRYWENDINTQITLIKEAGVKWVRLDIAQVVAEKERGYGFYDNIVNSLNKNGIGVILIIDQWGQVDQPWKNAFTSSAFYGEFAGRVAEHFKGRKIIFQLGNEPDYRDMSIPTYTQFLVAGYDAIKSKSSNATVITAGVGTSHSVEWMQGIYANGGKGKFDGFGLHRYVYPSPPNSGQFAILQQLGGIMSANGENKKVYITELGWMTGGEEGVSEENQAVYITEAYRLLENHRDKVEIACLYRFADKLNEGDDAHFGIVVEDKSQPDGFKEKPGYCAYKKITGSQNVGAHISCR